MISARSSATGLAALLLVACGTAPPPDAAGPGVPESPAASAAADAPPPEKPADDAKDDADAPKEAKKEEAKEKDKAPGQAAADSSALAGKLTQKDIQNIVFKNGELFNDCYTIGAGKGQQFVATVTIKATIGPKGTVNDARVQKSTAKNPKVDQCVADAFKKIAFPVPKDGATSTITFPMEFGGAEQVK